MAHSSETASQEMFKNQYSDLFCRVGDSCLAETIRQEQNDSVTILTLKTRMLNQLMTELRLPLSYVSQIQSHSTPVHPEVARELLRWVNKQEHVDALLAQDFVHNDKILKLIKSMSKSGHANIAHALLAMDGLGGKLNHVPNTECKKYVENLKYSLSGEKGRYDREANDDVKRAHVFAVREVYRVLDKQRSNVEKLVDGVYQVMRLILKERGGIDLPDVEENAWSEQVLRDGVKVYKENMNDEYFERFVEMMKVKNATNILTNGHTNTCVSDEEESGPSKRQRTK